MTVILHTHAVMSFILGLVAAGMFVHLIKLKGIVKAKNWLAAFYFAVLIWQIENIFRYSSPISYFNTIAYKLQTILVLIPALAVTHISHVQFAYQFMLDTYPKERKISLKITIILWLAELAIVIWNEAMHSDTMAFMLITAFFSSFLNTLWVIILSVRKARYLSVLNKKSSKAHYIYAGINGCYVFASLFSLYFGFFSTPGFWSYFSFVWLGNLASIVLYIVSSAVPAGFQTKVTGFTFVLAATVLSIITLTLYPPVLLNNTAVRLQQNAGLLKMMGIIAIVAVIIVVFMPLMLKISLTTPLQRLLKGVEQVNAGKLETQVPVGLHDEIGLLTQNFNRMTHSLKKSQDELTEYAQNLEKKVNKRTAQLQRSFNELKSTQAQLIQSEKMASLGELTAGIAHEIKNPLNFVTNFSELSVELFNELQEEINKPIPDAENMKLLAEDIAQNLQKINHHGSRAGAIVSSMLEHSHTSKGQKELTDINELVKEYLDVSYESMLLKNKNFTSIIETQLDRGIEKIDIIPQDLGRVLLNLYNNAFYSITEKKKNLDGSYEPKIYVSTKKLETSNSNDKDAENAAVIEITVQDNGMGIPEQVIDKIYQPFFTTKPAGHGTGLGLSLSYDIITKGYKGTLKAKSKEGEFAEFIITLPAQVISH